MTGKSHRDSPSTPVFVMTSTGNRLKTWTGFSGSIPISLGAANIQPISRLSQVASAGLSTLTEENISRARRRCSNFAPRFGFAYRPSNNDKTVIRAGYGIFYDTTETKEADDGGGYPFAQQVNLTDVSSTVLFPVSAALAPVTSADLGFLFIQTARTHTPYMQDWHLSIEREVFGGWKAEVDYLGSKGTHLLGRVWENAPTKYDPANPTPASARVPYPNIGYILDHFYDFYSNYNALQAKLEHSGRNYSAILSYTYSHSLDDKSSEAGSTGDTSGNGPQNEYDFNADYSSSSFDITNSFVGSFTAALPLAKASTTLAAAQEGLTL